MAEGAREGRRAIASLTAVAAVAAVAGGSAELFAQDASRDLVDAYRRADGVRVFDPSRVGGQVEATWLSDGVRFVYTATSPSDRGTRFLVDPRSGTRRPLEEGEEVPGAHSPARGPEWATRSPDGRWDAFVWNHDVYVRPAQLADDDPLTRLPRREMEVRMGCDAPGVPGPLSAGPVDPLPSGSIRLTRDGTERWGFGLYRFGIQVERVRAERYWLQGDGIQWAPDSRRFVVPRHDLRGVRTYPLYSSTSRLPVDHAYYYAAPGDLAVPRYDYWVFDVEAGSGTPVQQEPHDLLDSQSEARWGDGSEELWVVRESRGAKSVELSRVDPETGRADPVVADSMPTFVELRGWGVAGGGDDVFWVSERDGWSHVYRFDGTGTLKNRVTEGTWAVGSIQRVDPEREQLWFTAWGREPGVPYYEHLYRVDFDGSGLVHLTPDPGNHHVRFSPDGTHFLDTYSTIDTPPVTALRTADGDMVMELDRGDATELRTTGWTPAEVFTVKARNGETDLWGILHRPSDFEPSHRYPIIVNVYPGPQIGSVFQWDFKGADSRGGTQLFAADYGVDYYSVDGMGRSLAELGFVVMQLDALGTPKRSKAFQDFFYGRVRDNGLPDQIAAVRQLAARHPWIDSTRVGVWGHSGGGYASAAAMLDYPGFFDVGVSQSGNHDFRIYGWYWGEKYQGFYERTPEGDNYEDQANYRYAANLEGDLLLMTGDMDCNNPPAETLRLVDALIREGKDFEMLVVPDAGHQLPPYATNRSWDFFVRHLLGAEPPDYAMGR